MPWSTKFACIHASHSGSPSSPTIGSSEAGSSTTSVSERELARRLPVVHRLARRARGRRARRRASLRPASSTRSRERLRSRSARPHGASPRRVQADSYRALSPSSCRGAIMQASGTPRKETVAEVQADAPHGVGRGRRRGRGDLGRGRDGGLVTEGHTTPTRARRRRRARRASQLPEHGLGLIVVIGDVFALRRLTDRAPLLFGAAGLAYTRER